MTAFQHDIGLTTVARFRRLQSRSCGYLTRTPQPVAVSVTVVTDSVGVGSGAAAAAVRLTA
jgi:hypothetical protein